MNPSSMLRDTFSRLVGALVSGVVAAALAGCGGESPPDTMASDPAAPEAAVAADAGVPPHKPGGAGVGAGPFVQSGSGGAGVLRTWVLLGLDAVRTGSLSDAQAARLYAMLGAAMFDAVNGVAAQAGPARTHALVPVTGAPAGADASAAVSAAAHAVLTALRPALAAVYQAQLDADLAQIPAGQARTDGAAWGASVGNQVVALRANDGSSPTQTQAAGSGVGVFRASWSGVQFRNMQPFAIATAAPYVSGGPPPLNSLAYTLAFTDVSTVGNAAVIDLGFENTFQFWASGSGTVQPPGEWLKVALAVADATGLDLAGHARLFALLGMALADSVPPTVTAKFTYHFWRPATAIQEASSDGNLLTLQNAGWTPRAGNIGTSPEHVSGHSSFAGAGATVLRGFFCSDLIGFSLLTDSAPQGQARSYLNFSAAEAEAGRSRVLGGIHFEFSNQAGLQTGRGVAGEVLADSLLRTHGSTHSGNCPL